MPQLQRLRRLRGGPVFPPGGPVSAPGRLRRSPGVRRARSALSRPCRRGYQSDLACAAADCTPPRHAPPTSSPCCQTTPWSTTGQRSVGEPARHGQPAARPCRPGAEGRLLYASACAHPRRAHGARMRCAVASRRAVDGRRRPASPPCLPPSSSRFVVAVPAQLRARLEGPAGAAGPIAYLALISVQMRFINRRCCGVHVLEHLQLLGRVPRRGRWRTSP